MHGDVRISRICPEAWERTARAAGGFDRCRRGEAGMAGTVYIVDPTSWSHSVIGALRRVGFVVLRVEDQEAAGRLLRRRPADHIVVVDDPARLDALALAPWLCECAGSLLTIVTDSRNESRFLAGFTVGADDVVPPDCAAEVFVARVRALLRRTGNEPQEASCRISIGDITVEEESRQVLVRQRPVHLTPLEFSLLHTLMRDPGVVYSREDLLDSVWGSRHLAEERTIDAHIWKLRHKIERDAGRPRHIVSVPRLGYRFRRPDESRSLEQALAV